jgi:hypothetical protein
MDAAKGDSVAADVLAAPVLGGLTPDQLFPADRSDARAAALDDRGGKAQPVEHGGEIACRASASGECCRGQLAQHDNLMRMVGQQGPRTGEDVDLGPLHVDFDDQGVLPPGFLTQLGTTIS